MLDLADLNQIQDLLNYLNNGFNPNVQGHDLSATVALSDSSGNFLGEVRWDGTANGHVFEPKADD